MDTLSMRRPAVVIVAKAPVPGRVKTRLCPPLAPEDAATLYACFLQDTAAMAAALPTAEVFIALDIADSAGDMRDVLAAIKLPGLIKVIDQGEGDLGARLSHIVIGLAREHTPVVLIGADSPSLPRSLIDGAIRSLDEHDIVVGPSDDGGYYLIGLSDTHTCVFRDIDWSTHAVFEQTLARAASAGLTTDVLPGWYDVDDAADLRKLEEELREDPSRAPITAAALAMLRR